MKTLVGVDIPQTYRSSLDLCKKLKLPNQEWILASAVPLPNYFPANAYFGVNPGDEARKYLMESARSGLAGAHELVKDDEATEFLLDGEAIPQLMELADEQKVDLIVVGSGQPDGGLLWRIGSVSRALTYGAKQSLLVTKQSITSEDPIHAIFATDHSSYATRAAEQLIRWAPKGLGKIDIVTAYDLHPKSIKKLIKSTEIDLTFENWLRDEATKKSEALAEDFKKIAPVVNVRVTKGEVNEVIRRSMRVSGADLLILGAQGHGFFERLTIGSVALHQVVAEPYSVLVIRTSS